MRHPLGLIRDEKGSTAVEFALVGMMFMAVILFTMVDVEVDDHVAAGHRGRELAAQGLGEVRQGGRRCLLGLIRDEKGSTAVEFALVGMMFMAVILFTMVVAEIRQGGRRCLLLRLADDDLTGRLLGGEVELLPEVQDRDRQPLRRPESDGAGLLRLRQGRPERP
jgi:Flp pilus assembly pilin Flp